MSPGRRSVSRPRSEGTMQKVQVLLQPTLIETQAAYGESRRVGRLDGKVSNASLISTCASCRTRARSRSTGNEPMLWVPNTTSTDGNLHPRSCLLGGQQVAEAAIKAVVGVLAYRAGVEDHYVRQRIFGYLTVARLLQQPSEPLGVVYVHLAPIRANLIRALMSGPR